MRCCSCSNEVLAMACAIVSQFLRGRSVSKPVTERSSERRLVARRNKGANGSKKAASSGNGSGEPLGKVSVFMPLSYHETNRVVLTRCACFLAKEKAHDLSCE